LFIKILVKTRIGISIGYVCDSPRSSHIAGNTHTDPKTNLPYLELVGRLTPQLIARLVVEKQRGTFGIEHLGSFADDRTQEIIKSQLVCERLGYIEQNS
jgi:hypothetical protein